MFEDLIKIDEQNVAHGEFHTYSYETDCFTDARLSFYFEVVQEAAGCHAAVRGCSIPEMHKRGQTWVITRSQMEIFRYTRWPEVLRVETWAQEPIRLHLPRVVRAFDQDNNLLFVTKTHWAILELERGRPVRPADMAQVIKLPPEDDTEHNMDMNLARNEPPKGEKLYPLSTFVPNIAYLDTDRNQHVNNISYLSWALDSLPHEFRNRLKVKEVDVSFLRQTYLGENLMVYTESTDENAFSADKPRLEHHIVRTEEDGSETLVWVGHTNWDLRENLT